MFTMQVITEHPDTVHAQPPKPPYMRKRPPPALQFASEEVQDNYEVVKGVLLWNPNNIDYASDSLRALPEIKQAAIDSPYGLSSVPDEETSCSQLAHDSCDVQDDTDHVLAAVNRSGLELKFASTELRKDECVVAWACAPRTLKATSIETVKDYLGHWKNINNEHYRNQKKWRGAINDEVKLEARMKHEQLREAMCKLKTQYRELGEISLSMINILYLGIVDFPCPDIDHHAM
jgi:hypothetical protein